MTGPARLADTGAFERIEETLRSQGPDAVLDLLIASARERKNYRELFSARVMQVRRRLGLPLIETEPAPQLSAGQRPIYEQAFRDAARETGELFLAAGDIPNAWPYFKAIGEREPVAEAIEKVSGGDDLDRVIEIAFREGVNPRKGFELVLEHHGICTAITWYGSNRDYESRLDSLRLLVRTLYSELARALKETIGATEGASPATGNVAELIDGRDWLFEGNSYYVDSTHLASVLRFTPELEDRETLRMALEMAEYGRRLAPMFQFRGDPPFEEIYLDHAVYVRALLGEEVDAAVAHFREKASALMGVSPDTTPGEVLVELLVRLGRHAEAIRASLEFLPQGPSSMSSCPTALELCQMAGDYEQLRAIARDRGDALAYAAAVLQEPVR